MGKPIAIVGMAARFADAPTLHDFWKMCLDGRDAFGPVPPDRWNQAFFHSDNPRDLDRSYAPAGAFIDDIRSFPAVTLQIPPRRVEVMDPQQRMAIEVGLEAINDSGRSPEEMPERTAVFMGASATEYRSLVSARTIAMMMASGQLGQNTDPDAILAAVENVLPPRPFSPAGVLANMTACAVSQELKLRGAAYSVDAACSSSIVALYDAVAHLRAGNIDAALAGGVYLCLTPESHVGFSRIGAMSKQGRCLPFDARADGFVQGDGCGIVVLKRLEDAERDGDRIYGVIHGVAANNDAGLAGPMAPVRESQTDVIRKAWQDAGVDPALLGYLETHGTGTLAGDKAEFDGAYDAIGASVQRAALGSSKANIGHTMSAAGIAGVLRATLAAWQGQIPPLAGFESPKEDLGVDATNFFIPTRAEAWTAETRVAGVSSFGFGGTNTHLVLSSSVTTVATPLQPELVLLSSYDEASLRQLAGRTASALRHDRRASVAGVARAWASRRRQAWRSAIVATTMDELIEKLDALAAGQTPAGTVVRKALDNPSVAFLYPGQGAQRLGMIAGIRDRFAPARDALAQVEGAMAPVVALPITHYLYPERRASAVSDAQANEELTQTEHTQPALFSVAFALTRLLETAGVKPSVVAGHSVGEFAAAVAAGLMSPEDGARFVAERGRAMAAMTGDRGAMLAIRGDAAAAEALLVPGAVVANINHPQQVVISGRTAAIDEIQKRADAAGVQPVRLVVSHAFHSEVFDTLDMTPAVNQVDFREAHTPIASCIMDGTYTSPSVASEVFRAHAQSPVHFTRALENCAREGANVFVQVGAGGPIATFAKRTLADHHENIITLASNDDQDHGASLLLGLGELWVRGVELDITALTAPAPIASVPPLVLPKESYWGIKDSAQSRAKNNAAALEKASEAVALQVQASLESSEPTPTTTTESDPIIRSVMLAVAKASAYPVESLLVTMRLIEDLGFDSMMIADLIDELTRTVPGLTGVPRELFASSPTIDALIEYARAPQRAGVDASSDNEALAAFRPIWLPAGALEQRTTRRPQAALVRSDATPQAQAMAQAIRAALPTADVAATDDASSPTQAIIFCADMEPPAAASVDALTGTHTIHAVEQVLSLLAPFAAQEAHPDVFVVLRADNPWHQGIAGALRALQHEWPDARVRSIFIDADMALSQVGELVTRELLATDTSNESRWIGDRRFLRGFERLPFQDAPKTTNSVRALVTGGTRGIGLAVAKRLAQQGAHVTVIGRSAPGADEQAIIDASQGAIVAAKADVNDAEALRAVVDAHGPFNTLIHSAGVLADGALESVDPSIGRNARAVKVGGWLHAIAAIGDTLERAVAIGSWAGRFGNRHQVHYAAANALLAGLVDAADASVHASIAEFGPWVHSEMAATIPDAVKSAMRNEGVDFVGDEVGIDAIVDQLARTGTITRGRRVPRSLATNRVVEELSVASHPFLADHAIQGVPVFPLASAADLIARVSEAPTPFVIRDLELFQGIRGDRPLTLDTRLQRDSVEIRSGDGAKTLHYRAAIAPLERAPAPTRCTGGEPSTIALETFYSDITFHGPLLAGIVRIDGIGNDFVRGVVRVGTPGEWEPKSTRSAWSISPLAFDSAMQMAAMVAWQRYRMAGTPMSIETLTVLRSPQSETLVAEVTFQEPSESKGFVANVALWTDDGELVAYAEGVRAEMKSVDQAADDAASFEIKAEWVDPSQWDGYKDISARIQMLEMVGLKNPYFDLHEGTARNRSFVDGREVINFSSYNYIGYSGDPRVVKETQDSIARYGTSVSASRVASGERPFHRELEAELAAANDCEDAIVFSGGHATNVNVIGHLFGPRDLILHDELIHDSCLQGIKLSGAARRSFRHDDPAHLEEQLRQLRGNFEKVLILIEGVYSMDGDIAKVPEYVRLKKKYGCLLMIDEAHSFGTVGATGLGVREHFGLKGSDADIWMGTMSKSLASMGGWVSGSKPLIMHLRYSTPGFVFAAGIPPALGVAALASLRLMIQEPERVEKLQSNSRFFYKELRARGLDTGPSVGESPVIPVVTGDSMIALQLSQRLLDDGINAKPIIFPAVANDAARLRFFLSSTHTEEELSHTAARIAELLEEIRQSNAG